MTPNEFLATMQTIRDTSKPDNGGSGLFNLGGVFDTHDLKVGWSDAAAAKLLLWVQEQWPELTEGQAEDILLSALWWLTFWASMEDKRFKMSRRAGR